MTPEQMQTTIRLVSVLWPNPKQDMQRLTAGYAVLLADRPYVDVESAIRALAESGREWPPPPGVVVKQIESTRRVSGMIAALDRIRPRKELT